MERHLYDKVFLFFNPAELRIDHRPLAASRLLKRPLALMFTLSHKLTLLQLILDLLKPNTLERYLDYDGMICTKAHFFNNSISQISAGDRTSSVPLSYKFTPKKRKKIYRTTCDEKYSEYKNRTEKHPKC